MDFAELPAYQWAMDNDGLDGDGTTVDAAIAACKALGYCQDYYQREDTLDDGFDEFKYALRLYSNVICGWAICDGWNKLNDRGVIPDGGKMLGGHAVLAVKYEDFGPVFANSWGRKTWGINGFGQCSWAEFQRIFWVARAVEWVL